jgi:CDP-diacylglycerol--glycerol-3-phosphate 3-phosphatidyltransferase/cardiolipin synthase
MAFALYCLMGITDYFDGLLARSSGAVSRLGIFLDPIADKIMVAVVILVLTAQGILRGPYVGDMHVIAGLIILVREIAVSGLREFLGGLQVSVPVSQLAKWKTTLQFVSLGALILGRAMPEWNVATAAMPLNVPHTVGLTTLWGAAILTVITGWDYLRVGLKHMD